MIANNDMPYAEPHPSLSGSLSAWESEELARLEAEIDEQFRHQFRIGAALRRIRDLKLYRASHATMEEYCRARWDIGRSTAYQWMATSEVCDRIVAAGEMAPASENEIRPLLRLASEEQLAAYRQARAAAGQGSVTYGLVKGVVDDILAARRAQERAAARAAQSGGSVAAVDQYLAGDPLAIAMTLPQAQFDLLLIPELSGQSGSHEAQRLGALLSAASSTLKQDCQVFVFCEQQSDAGPLLRAAEEGGFQPGLAIRWASGMRRIPLKWSVTAGGMDILHLRRGEAALVTELDSVIECPQEQFRRHANQRPLELLRALIEAATVEGACVLDLAAGAASSLLACRQLSRHCFAVEPDPQIHAAGRERLAQATPLADAGEEVMS